MSDAATSTTAAKGINNMDKMTKDLLGSYSVLLRSKNSFVAHYILNYSTYLTRKPSNDFEKITLQNIILVKKPVFCIPS